VLVCVWCACVAGRGNYVGVFCAVSGCVGLSWGCVVVGVWVASRSCFFVFLMLCVSLIIVFFGIGRSIFAGRRASPLVMLNRNINITNQYCTKIAPIRTINIF
jgi:hypothetical protein